MDLDQHVISRVFQFSLAFFGARSILFLSQKIVTYFSANFLIVCMPYPRSISLNLRGKKTLLSISFQQDGLEKSTPDPVGHYHCFLLITINKFKKNKMKF